jgi:hypothetical protein
LRRRRAFRQGAEKDSRTVFGTEREILNTFYIRSEKATPSQEIRSILEGILLVEGSRGRPSPPIPLVALTNPKENASQPATHSYMDSCVWAFRNHGKDTRKNRELAILIVDRGMELDKAGSK